MILQTAPNRAHRVLQPIPLGGQHVQQLATARHQRVQLLDDRVGQRYARHLTSQLFEPFITSVRAHAIGSQSEGSSELCAYTCYLPGQFTAIADNEGGPVGNLHFAGEHANSFYVWQGFMEGALLSGIDAANQISLHPRPWRRGRDG